MTSTLNELPDGSTIGVVRNMFYEVSKVITSEDKLITGVVLALTTLMMGFSAWLVGMGIKAACSGGEHPTRGPSPELAQARARQGPRKPQCEVDAPSQSCGHHGPLTTPPTTSCDAWGISLTRRCRDACRD